MKADTRIPGVPDVPTLQEAGFLKPYQERRPFR